MDSVFSQIFLVCDKKCENKNITIVPDEDVKPSEKTENVVDIILKNETTMEIITDEEKASDTINSLVVDISNNKKKENQRKYNQKFIEKNKDKVKEQIECDKCGGFYTYYNKSSHNKTARHQRMCNRN